MPRQKGMVLTERDRALLGYLGVARYVTGAQAHRLLAPGHDKAITSRRLARLCELGPNPGDDAYLRRLEYRRSNSLPFPVWTLTPHGRALAEPLAPGPVAAVQPGVGILFIERILALNELLIALILAARRSESAPLADLPFRWCVADQPLRFETFDRVYMTRRPAVLRPGAVIDLPRTRNRIFLEPELGTTSLAPADPRQGHVKRRLERYVEFFGPSRAGTGSRPGTAPPSPMATTPKSSRWPAPRPGAPRSSGTSRTGSRAATPATRCALSPSLAPRQRSRRWSPPPQPPHLTRLLLRLRLRPCILPSDSPDCARPRHRRGPQAPFQGWDQVLRRGLQLLAKAGVGPRQRLSQLQARPGSHRRVERVP